MNKHLTKISKLIVIICSAAFLLSCATQSILIEIPKKSKDELPEHIQSVLLISRVVNGTYSNIDADSLQRIFYEQNFDYDTIVNDSVVVDTLLKALGDILFESGRYDYVIPENRFLPSDNNILLIGELPWEEVKKLCGIYNTDAIISLDHIKTRLVASLHRATYINPYGSGFISDYEALLSIRYEALMRIYDPSNEKVLSRKLLRDTLYWSDYDRSLGNLFSDFTSVKNGLMETGIAIAIDFSDELIPRWIRERRIFFAAGNKELKQAAPLISSNNWEPAMALWKKTAETSNSKNLKSKAEFNIALGYELQDDLDKAIEWALKSYTTLYRTNTYEYLEILKRRKNEQINQ